MSALFSQEPRHSSVDEVDNRLELLHSIVDLKTNKAEKKTKVNDMKHVFFPRRGERPLDAVRRRMAILETVINQYDGVRRVLSREDKAEYDRMINSDNKEERESILQQIFVVRNKATCLRLAYSAAIDRLGRGEATWKSCCEEVQKGMGLPHAGKTKNIIDEYNRQFCAKDQFALVDNGEGHQSAVAVPVGNEAFGQETDKEIIDEIMESSLQEMDEEIMDRS
jgi:hypothetical protein